MLLVVAVPALAADPLRIVCPECRNPSSHPEDYRNFAWNQTFGPNGWLSPSQADRFQIVNISGIVVDIDMDFVLKTVSFFYSSSIPDDQVSITVQLSNGDQFVYQVMAGTGELPVGGNSGSSGGSVANDPPRFESGQHYFTYENTICRADFIDPYSTGVVCRTETVVVWL